MLTTKSAPVSAARRLGAALSGDLVRDALCRAQPVGVDVVQADGRLRQLGEAEEVGQELAGEHDTAGADEGDGDHGRHPGLSSVDDVRSFEISDTVRISVTAS
jgi:hypothetical protein